MLSVKSSTGVDPIYMHINMYTYVIYAYVYTFIRHLYVYICIYYIRIYYIHIYVYMNTRSYICICIYTCI